MPLSNAFYIEVFAKEQKWLELIDQGLLNSVYCTYELKPFYLEKKNQLEEDCKQNSNEIKRTVLSIFNRIINEIDELDKQYKTGRKVDINVLQLYFLTTQLNNSNKLEHTNLKKAK